MTRQLPARQRIRKAFLILAFLSFPITMNYLSPYVIIDGAANGVITGSLIIFGLMFIFSLFLGRAWCGWVCPGGGMEEIIEPVNSKAVNGRKMDWIKWFIWIPWISLIIFLVIKAGGYSQIDFTYATQNGISIAGDADRPIIFAYLIYYIVIGLFIGTAVIFGRRAGCHSFCWMAPFMIIGRWIRNRFAYPSLRLKVNSEDCINCKKCTINCAMSLDVNKMVNEERMENSECILCGSCVDGCPHSVIRYSFSAGK
ncbi:MAG: 4Fe-4S binding protein [Anaerolineaceae bacterium]|nr:4Fe-4S binding protein [Anaerolineaceae bacterium]